MGTEAYSRGTTRNSPYGALETDNGVIRRTLLLIQAAAHRRKPARTQQTDRSIPFSLDLCSYTQTACSSLFAIYLKHLITVYSKFQLSQAEIFHICASFFMSQPKNNCQTPRMVI